MTAGFLPIGELNNVGGSTSTGPPNTVNNPSGGNLSTTADSLLTTDELMEKIRQGDRRPFPEWFSKPLVSLLSAMMVLNAYRR